MATICAEELQLMQKKSTRSSLLVEYIAVSLELPFAYLSIAIVSMYLFILMFFYFKTISVNRLSACYDVTKPHCVKCLRKIYKNEQNILKFSRKLQKKPFLKWIYCWIGNKLEDRAETLILSVDEEASRKLISIIHNIETRKPEKSNWTQELHAL